MNNLTKIEPTCDSYEVSDSNTEGSVAASACRLYRGDNIDVLEELTKKKEQFDFCYIDPPYNTKNRFMYEDAFVSVEHPIWGDNGAWMDFMLMRFQKLHGLLKENGIVAVSIDDNEQPYLRVLLDLVFGKKNFIACIAVCRSRNGKGGGRGVSVNHEYIVIYGKSKSSKAIGLPDVCTASYNKSDEYGHFRLDGLFRKKGDASKRSDRPRMHYPLYYCDKGKVYVENVTGSLKEALPVDSKGVERRWIWGKDKARDESWRLYASKRRDLRKGLPFQW